MTDKILIGATDLFLNYGFKSVTMDDIATNLGISKKTIYQYYDNKTKLVEAVTMQLFETISIGIDQIRALQQNPIEEIFSIKHFIMQNLKDEKSFPYYQLEKYYPKLYKTLKTKHFEVMQSCVTNNLERGISLGLFRKTLNVPFISRLYFNSTLALKDNSLFPLHHFSMPIMMNEFLEYHLRGICTEEGLKILNKFITTNQA